MAKKGTILSTTTAPMVRALIEYRDLFDEECDDNAKIINGNLIELQDNIHETLQYLDSMLCDLKDAVNQPDMRSAQPYIGNADTNLYNAMSVLNNIDIASVIEDIKQLQQQRIMDTLRQ